MVPLPLHLHFDVNNLIHTLLGNEAKIVLKNRQLDSVSTLENQPYNFTFM